MKSSTLSACTETTCLESASPDMLNLARTYVSYADDSRRIDRNVGSLVRTPPRYLEQCVAAASSKLSWLRGFTNDRWRVPQRSFSASWRGRLLGEVHRTHAALPEFADHPVAGHLRAGRQREAANETGARLALLAAHRNSLRLGCNRFSTVERNPGMPPD